jgi:hypothetical protein
LILWVKIKSLTQTRDQFQLLWKFVQESRDTKLQHEVVNLWLSRVEGTEQAVAEVYKLTEAKEVLVVLLTFKTEFDAALKFYHQVQRDHKDLAFVQVLKTIADPLDGVLFLQELDKRDIIDGRKTQVVERTLEVISEKKGLFFDESIEKRWLFRILRDLNKRAPMDAYERVYRKLVVFYQIGNPVLSAVT